jgi:5-formyltetrahydrofolate cyclo-ligase
MPTGEVDTSSLVQEILNAGKFGARGYRFRLSKLVRSSNVRLLGKALYVPRIVSVPPTSHMDLLQIYDNEDLQSLPGGTWGIKEPALEWKSGKRMSGALPL